MVLSDYYTEFWTHIRLVPKNESFGDQNYKGFFVPLTLEESVYVVIYNVLPVRPVLLLLFHTHTPSLLLRGDYRCGILLMSV